MPLPTDTMRSLERLDMFQEAFDGEDIPQSKSLFQKTDSLFLLILIIGLFSFSAFLLLLVNKTVKQSAEKKQQQASSEKKVNVLEISLGEFESMKTSRKNPEYLSVIEYEATLSVEGSMIGIMQNERVIYSRKNRLRSIVEIEINSASVQELSEPDLGSIRTSILRQVNKFLGDDSVNDVLFPHYVRFNLPASP